jgi:protein-disulfide isomerase
MQKFSILQWRWLVVIVLVLVLAACVAQIPSVTPAAPAAQESATAETTVVVTDVATDTVETSATDAPASETPGNETPTVEATAVETATANATSESVAPESSAPVAEGEAAVTEESSPTETLALIGGAPIPSDETYKGLPVGFTEDGLLYRGDPNAPLVLVEYSDFQCPFCHRYFVQTEPAMDESYVRTGQVRVVFHDFPLVSLHPNAPAAHEASLCVADQGSATQYWNFHAELFRSVEEWEPLSDPLPVFARLAEEGGVDMTAYNACLASHENQSVVQARVDEAFARGFNATPSFQLVRTEDNAVFQLIGAQPYEQFAAVVDSALAGEMPVAAAPTAEPSQDQGIPFWATAEGWQPDPDRPGFNMAGDEYRGDINAPLTIIEFSDFQCPYCQRHNAETQPVLDEKYVDTGKVLWVYKHFPLSIHPQAPAAAIAAECAADQGKFWEMHDALFNSVQEWSIDDPTEVFKSLAANVGLDADAFAACLTDPAIEARVSSDEGEGEQFVQGTPTFIVVHGNQGSIIPGALPEASFSKVIEDELAKAGAAQ